MKFIYILLLALAVPTQAFAQSLTTMVNEVTKDIKRSTETKIAVLEFSYADGRRSQGPAIIQERVTTALVKKHLGTVVERKLLDRVLGELKFQQTGVVDQKTIKQIGKILGADYVVAGTLNDVNPTQTEVNARIINAESAQVIGADSVVIDKTWIEAPIIDGLGNPVPMPEEPTGIAKTKEFMDARLGELKKGIGTTIKPREDGQLEVNGVVVNEEDFSKAVMKTLLNDVKSTGLETPPMAEEGKP